MLLKSENAKYVMKRTMELYGEKVVEFIKDHATKEAASGKLGFMSIPTRGNPQELLFNCGTDFCAVLQHVYLENPSGLSNEDALKKACEIAKTPEFVATHNHNLHRKETNASKELKAMQAMGQAAGQPALVGGAGSAGASGSAGSAGASGSAGGAGNFMPAPAPFVAPPRRRRANASNIAQPAPKRQALPVVTAFQVPAGASVANSFASVLGRPVAVATQAPILQAVPYVPAPVAAPAQAPAQAPALTAAELLAIEVLKAFRP